MELKGLYHLVTVCSWWVDESSDNDGVCNAYGTLNPSQNLLFIGDEILDANGLELSVREHPAALK